MATALAGAAASRVAAVAAAISAVATSTSTCFPTTTAAVATAAVEASDIRFGSAASANAATDHDISLNGAAGVERLLRTVTFVVATVNTTCWRHIFHVKRFLRTPLINAFRFHFDTIGAVCTTSGTTWLSTAAPWDCRTIKRYALANAPKDAGVVSHAQTVCSVGDSASAGAAFGNPHRNGAPQSSTTQAGRGTREHVSRAQSKLNAARRSRG
eukprot:TRINITY_DN28253_c1_g1_i1.p2 TRINITY_DN28253_c1_g1~~TRINITY_DN28253_c1_g1_i1.p2  ORF type:complete len:213 (-),score=20.16 TRINITY_DN28253_c1_g1_i1:42-680(-)